MSASAIRKQVAIVHDSSGLSMKTIVTDEASIAKGEAGLAEPLSREHELLPAERWRVASAVTHNSFRNFGINE